MEMFKKIGGRLLRIALLFVVVSVLTIGIMAYFTHRIMEDVKEIALTRVAEGEKLPDVEGFYIQLVNNLKIGTVISSLAGVLIAIVARYGLRETAKSIGDGMSNRAVKNNTDEGV
jgi:hypothetical protein